MNTRLLWSLSLALLLSTTVHSAADIRHVPSQNFPTLSAALQNTNDAIIILAAGEYNENVIVPRDFTGIIQNTNPNDPEIVQATVFSGFFQIQFPRFDEIRPRIRGLTFLNTDVVVSEFSPVQTEGTLFLEHCRFEYSGVSLYIDFHAIGKIYIQDCTFIDSNYGVSSVGTTVHIRRCAFYRNLFPIAGSIAELSESNICESLIDGVNIHGAYDFDSSDLEVDVARNEFSDNLATALRFTPTFDTPIVRAHVTDNYFIANDAGVEMSGHTEIRNCTIVGNQLYGVAFSGQPDDRVENSILFGNGRSIAGDYPDAIVTYSCIDNPWTGPGNIVADPDFVNPAAGNYHLLETSVCINAGTPAYDWTFGAYDSDGDLRVRVGRIDIGADETPYDAPDGGGGGGIRGDMNDDGVVDGLDVQEFVNVLLSN